MEPHGRVGEILHFVRSQWLHVDVLSFKLLSWITLPSTVDGATRTSWWISWDVKQPSADFPSDFSADFLRVSDCTLMCFYLSYYLQELFHRQLMEPHGRVGEILEMWNSPLLIFLLIFFVLSDCTCICFQLSFNDCSCSCRLPYLTNMIFFNCTRSRPIILSFSTHGLIITTSFF